MRRATEASLEKGAALIELAMVLPLILMLIVGMVSAAIAYNHQLALSHAAREGGRFAATLPVSNYGSMDLWLDAVAQAVGDDATGTLGAGAPGRYVCVAYVHPDGTLATDKTSRRVDAGGVVTYDYDITADPSDDVNVSCFSDGRPDSERRVQVEVRRDTEFSVAFFSTTLNLDSEGVSRYEAAVGG